MEPITGASLMALMVFAVLLGLAPSVSAGEHETGARSVVIADRAGDLALHLAVDGRCVLERVVVRGRDVVAPETGVCSAILVEDRWHTTRAGIPAPRVTVDGPVVRVEGIRFGGDGIAVEESWTFTGHEDRITWRIDRRYTDGGMLEDTYFPGWDFRDRSTWTGALLGTGGVAWFRLFDTHLATYGVRTDQAVFWSREHGDALRIRLVDAGGLQPATRFTRHPSEVVSFNFRPAASPAEPRHDLRRFLRDRTDVWAPFAVEPSAVTVTYELAALDYDREYGRGALTHFDERSVREILNTIARIGAVDERIHGSNGWYSGYAVLHEAWIAQLGLAINDPNYHAAYARTLDFQRDHAIAPDGRVKSRWSYTAHDAIPGTYDRHGFYECQWGYLMDTQPCWVINVAEQFDFTGDLEWVRGHKDACERALDHMLRRDSNANGLVEVMVESHTEKRASDWIDVVWASFETAFVNAQMYYAMTLWADIEELLGDDARAAHYRAAARRLKEAFNAPTTDGGFWQPENRWYVYWREKDGSVYGDNLVIPINFMAIGYGLCDDGERRDAILSHIERKMTEENLFFWPLNIYSYKEEEGGGWPFPTYENGDIFLGWGELGVRAYADYDPAVAVKYVRNVLDRYEQDGLAFQRYLRIPQTGEGGDILANNCSPIVGLYRNIYGIQPRYNRLYLRPRLTHDLDGTRLRYDLRGQRYMISLDVGDYTISAGAFALRASTAFGADIAGDSATYFHEESAVPALAVTRACDARFALRIEAWSADPEGPRRWSETATRSDASLRRRVIGLAPGREYALVVGGEERGRLRADPSGSVAFDYGDGYSGETRFELRPSG